MTRRLLIIDDEPDFCDFVADVAEHIGFETLKVTEPLKFKQAYRSFEPCAIVIDMVMPEIDGFEVLHWLVEQECTAKVLIVTGYNPLYARSAQLQSSAKGLPQAFEEDAGQTFAVWGAEGGGPYLMLPLLGPSNVRDALGTAAELSGSLAANDKLIDFNATG